MLLHPINNFLNAQIFIKINLNLIQELFLWIIYLQQKDVAYVIDLDELKSL